MGLSISPGYSSSYGAFNDLRAALAREEKADLGGLDGEAYRGALAPLLHHSDCSGYLGSMECEAMLPRLGEILDTWRALADQGEIDLDATDHVNIDLLAELADAMQGAVQNRYALEFT